MAVFLKARAKINVALDITGKRPDGYHDLRTIMQTVNLYDTLQISRIEKPRIKLVSNLSWLPVDERNLVYKAAEILMREYKVSGGLFIDLVKNIPVSAGLAGGSADCAAALIGIRNLCSLPIKDDELIAIGKSLGADIPYCFMRGTALAEGIGDKLTRLEPHPSVYVLLVKPTISVSTESVFKKFKLDAVSQRPDIDKMVTYVSNKDLNGIVSEMHNVLESVTATSYPIIQELKKTLMEAGAMASLMSGSGPTVFAYFKTREEGKAAIFRIKEQFETIKDVYLTTLFNRSLYADNSRSKAFRADSGGNK